MNNKEYFVGQQYNMWLHKNILYDDSFVKSLNKWGDYAFCVRAEDKLSRFAKLSSKEDLSESLSVVCDEKISDTVRDLFNYCAMFYSWTGGIDVFDSLKELANDSSSLRNILMAKYWKYEKINGQFVETNISLLDENIESDVELWHKFFNAVDNIVNSREAWIIK